MNWPEHLIQSLERAAARDDRAVFAALRRSLDEETASMARAAQHVARYLPMQLDAESERMAYLVAGLFALHPTSGGTRTIAAALRSVMERRDSPSIEGRFTALLGADVEDLAPHLRHVVTLIRGDDVQFDWLQLLNDLRFWSHPDGKVQRRWARDFWADTEHSTSISDNTERTTP